MRLTEKQNQSYDREEGVISCYLCLILLLLLSLIAVTLESARTSGGRFLSESITRMAAASVLGGYSSTLFERYHVFAYNSNAASSEETIGVLKRETSNYIERNLSEDNQTLWKLQAKNVEVTNYLSLTDNGGQLFREQAVNYMKYRGIPILLENLIPSFDQFESAQKTTELLESKAQTEEALEEIDYCILQLFSSVEGLAQDGSGLKMNLFGKMKAESYFVKMLLQEEVTAEQVQINQQAIFEVLKDAYVDPEVSLIKLEGYIKDRNDAQEKGATVQRNLISAQSELEWLAEQEGAEAFARRVALELEIKAYEAELLVFLTAAEYADLQYSITSNKLQKLFRSCREKVEASLATLSVIEERQNSLAAQVLSYESEVLTAAAWLDQSLYDELSSSLGVMKAYVGIEVPGVERILDVETMKATLQQDKDVLTRILNLAESSSMERGDSEASKVIISTMRTHLSEYSHEGLVFDYEGMKLNKEGESPVETFGELLLGGIAGFVIKDSDELSKKQLLSQKLPSQGGEESGGSRGIVNESDWSSKTKAGPLAMLQSVNKSSLWSELGKLVYQSGAEFTEKVLFVGYLNDHFSDYQQKPEESVLDYELEYILCGEEEDATNLSLIIGKILLVRIAFCLIHVLSDSEKCSTAQTTATGLLGFTGLPILVSIMKFLLLFIWAVEGALIETAAILQGKKVALMPTATRFDISFSELAMLSKSFILEKAEARTTDGGVALSYQEYLLLFLLLQEKTEQSLRTLDLIQENVANKEGRFLADYAVSSFCVQAVYLLPEFFARIPFLKERSEKCTYRVRSEMVY